MAASDITILSGVPTFTYTSGGIRTRCTILTCPLLSLLPSRGVDKPWSTIGLTITMESSILLLSPLSILDMYRLYHEMQVYTGTTHRGPKARGCVNLV